MPEVIIPGPEGRLEGRYQHSRQPNAPLALLLHPHPEHGGTMNNKVVYHMHHAFARRGFSVLRFNFRGVGRSQGRFDRGEGELSDAASALDWMQGHNENAAGCWVAGFSFGAWIGMQLLMRRPEIEGLHLGGAAGQHLYDFGFPGALPLLRDDCPRRSGHDRSRGISGQARQEALVARRASRSTTASSREPIISFPSTSINS